MLGWLVCAVFSFSAGAHEVEIRSAAATIVVDGRQPVQKKLDLPHRWDADFPGQTGRVRYVLELPPLTGDEPMSLYFARLGNQVEISVNGELLVRRGVIGDASSDATKIPFWLTVPTRLLDRQRSSELVILASMQANRWGGLSPPLWGTVAETYPYFRKHYVWRHYVALAVVISMLCMGLVAVALWRIQRDEVFAWFALAAAFGVVRFLDTVVSESWLPWPLAGGCMAAALQIHSISLVRFCLAALEFRWPWLNRATWGLLSLEAIAAMAALMLGHPWHWNLVLLSLLPVFLAINYWVIRQVLLTRATDAIMLAVFFLVATAVALRDLIAVRIMGEGPGMIFWSPAITLVFVGIAGWIITHRFSRQMRINEELLVTLDTRIQSREAELKANYAQLQQRQTLQATLQERQRLTRDIHDGVGAQLVGLLSLVGDAKTGRDELADQVKAAMDELRMAVDSLQPAHDDLTTMLATLRYRIQPRLDALGIALIWRIGILPQPDGLTPVERSHIQRIIFEALTNVMRHAQATEVRIDAVCDDGPPQAYRIAVEDNGKGLGDQPVQRFGHGLTNMQVRAEGIHAQLTVESMLPTGTRVSIHLPVGVSANRRTGDSYDDK